MTKKKILKNKKTPYLNPLANLECKNHWDFRDAVGLICQRPNRLDYEFYYGENDYSKTYGAFKTVWDLIIDALIEKKIKLVKEIPCYFVEMLMQKALRDSHLASIIS